MREKESVGKKPLVVINIEHQLLSTILGILTQVSSGESSPVFIEGQVRELQKYVPFLPTAISWMAEAIDRLAKAKDGDIANDPAALREFLTHESMLCRAQGAVAALICVGESLRTQAEREVEATKSTPKRSTPKRSTKGNRNATRRDQS